MTSGIGTPGFIFAFGLRRLDGRCQLF